MHPQVRPPADRRQTVRIDASENSLYSSSANSSWLLCHGESWCVEPGLPGQQNVVVPAAIRTRARQENREPLNYIFKIG